MSADTAPGPVSGLSRQSSVYRRMMAVCDKLAAAAVQGADAVELTRIFAQTAGKTVILLDPGLRPQAQAASAGDPRDWDQGDASLEKLLRLLTAERRPLQVPPVPGSALACGCLAMPVSVGDTTLGYLLVLDEKAASADDVDLIGGAIVDSLVSGHFLDSTDARRKARILGVTDAQPFRVAVARLSAPATSPPGQPEEHDRAGELLARLAGSIEGGAAIRERGRRRGLPGDAGTAPAPAGRRHQADLRAPRADPVAGDGTSGPAAGPACHRPGSPARAGRPGHLLRGTRWTWPTRTTG